MRRIAYVLVAAAAFVLVTGDGLANPTPKPTLSVPAAAEGGAIVVVSGSSPSGAAGTTIRVSDDNGRLKPIDVTWMGSEFTVKFFAPKFNPDEPDNEIEVLVKPQAPSRSVSELIPIRA